MGCGPLTNEMRCSRSPVGVARRAGGRRVVVVVVGCSAVGRARRETASGRAARCWAKGGSSRSFRRRPGRGTPSSTTEGEGEDVWGPGGGLFDFGAADNDNDNDDEAGSRGDASKNAKKRRAREYMEAAELLTRLSKKQVRSLGPYIDEAVLDLVSLAQKLSVRNQGRKRLEQTIAKHLRSDEVDLLRLQGLLKDIV